MTETLEPTISSDSSNASVLEALSVIDQALATFHARELLSADEVSNLLLDVRTVLTSGARREPAGANAG